MNKKQEIPHIILTDLFFLRINGIDRKNSKEYPVAAI